LVALGGSAAVPEWPAVIADTVAAAHGQPQIAVVVIGDAPKVTATKAGKIDYTCTMHPGQHNPASITAS